MAAHIRRGLGMVFTHLSRSPEYMLVTRTDGVCFAPLVSMIL
jgi:hypothetical protein